MTSPALSLAGTDREVREAALRYWSDFGWPVRTNHTEVVLSLQQDLLAVAMPAGRGEPLLEILEAEGARGGVVSLRGSRRQWWAFLITPAERWRVPPTRDLWMFSEGSDLPLPHDTALVTDVGWIREPTPGEALFDGDRLLDATTVLSHSTHTGIGTAR